MKIISIIQLITLIAFLSGSNSSLSGNIVADVERQPANGNVVADQILAKLPSLIESVRHNPNSRTAHTELGMAYAALNREDEAIVEYKKALRIDPFYAEIRDDLGHAYAAHGQEREAIDELKKAIRLNPHNHNPFYILGKIHYRQEDYGDAIKMFIQAINLKPDLSDAYNSLGSSYEKLGKHHEAVEAYNETVRLDPRSGTAYQGLAEAYVNLGMNEEAISAGKRAIDLNPNNAFAYNSLGTVYEENGKHVMAAEAYKKAIQLKPDMLSFYSKLELIYSNLRRYHEAAEVRKKVYQLENAREIKEFINYLIALNENHEPINYEETNELFNTLWRNTPVSARQRILDDISKLRGRLKRISFSPNILDECAGNRLKAFRGWESELIRQAHSYNYDGHNAIVTEWDNYKWITMKENEAMMTFKITGDKKRLDHLMWLTSREYAEAFTEALAHDGVDVDQLDITPLGTDHSYFCNYRVIRITIPPDNLVLAKKSRIEYGDISLVGGFNLIHESLADKNVGAGNRTSIKIDSDMKNAIVVEYYKALEEANGTMAAELIAPRMRNKKTFNPRELDKYYGSLEESIMLIDIFGPSEDRGFEVAYTLKEHAKPREFIKAKVFLEKVNNKWYVVPNSSDATDAFQHSIL